jgi:tetratricopeptide (TPR) repeat protein
MNTNSNHIGDLKENNSFKSRSKELIIQNGLHASATVIILSALFVLYQFIVTVDPKKIFSDNYHTYEVRVMRGAAESSPLKEAYRNGQMDSVIWEFNSLNAPQPEEYLLAGIAFLEDNQPAKAIETFKTMIQKNTISKTDYFQDDADYYLAMSYLSNKEPEKAMPIFEKIQADENNPYYSSVNSWFLLDVKTSIAKK